MKTYRSHKVVTAGKIKSIGGVIDTETGEVANSQFLVMHDGGRVPVSDEYIAKHKPEIGGYFVQYADGYQSFSPAEAFEAGYSEVESVTTPPG